jgi:hypothetical protein
MTFSTSEVVHKKNDLDSIQEQKIDICSREAQKHAKFICGTRNEKSRME